jgi:RimJ/RimL family protein N-acetyltransferase
MKKTETEDQHRNTPRSDRKTGRSRSLFSPIIETPRLILRQHRDEDHSAYARMCADPEISRFSGKDPSGPDEAWMRLLRNVGHWALFGYGFFAIEEKESRRLVGEAGLADFRRELAPGLGKDPEAGWAIEPSVQGKGYATEAAAAALDWMESCFGTPRSVCIVHAGNFASLRVAEKLGYRVTGEIDYRGYRARTFERFAP